MTFDDIDVTLQTAAGPIRARVTASALHGLWGAGSGPQTGEGLLDAHRSMIESTAAEMFAAGEVHDGVVVIDDAALDI